MEDPSMDKRPNSVGLLPQPQEEKVITSQLFEAYLDCPTKCFLRSTGEAVTGNAFATWNHTRSEAYHLDGVRRLTAGQPQEFGSYSIEPGSWKSALWLFARSQGVSAQNMATTFHVVQRIPPEGTSKASQLVPIRFVHANKLSRSDKLMAGFDALVLSKAFGIKVGLAKIIYGDHAATFKLRTNTVSREVNKTIGEVAALLSAPSPPILALNRHCPVCEFRDYCRKKSVERNDLSLLPNLPLKERERLNSRGIFTVSQLSYTFRPRRRIKQRASRPEKYHHALKALAIREQKIHVVGSPQLRVDGTAILFDVEGDPDRNFYYLIGARVEDGQSAIHHSFWANGAADEERIWRGFLNILSDISDPILIHFGAFETAFLKRMCRRYGGPPNDSAAAKAIALAINLLSVIYAQVYLPTYSNGLKEIARFLGFEWTNSVSSGLQSIIWRHEWEASGDPALRAELIAYNADDCKALSLVLRTLGRISKLDFDTPKSFESEPDIVHERSLGKSLASKWTPFRSPLSELEHINRAARWNYQRDRVFVRSGTRKKKQSRENAIRKAMSRGSGEKRPQISVVLSSPISCPKCGKQERTRHRLLSRIVHDLVFGRYSVKGRIVKYIAQTYRCGGCGHEYGLHDACLHGYRWGLNVRAYFIYHIVGLCVPQLTMRQNLNRLFGFDLSQATLNNFKVVASKLYSATKKQILDRIVHGTLIHADETRANIKGRLAYVWVLTNLREVVYILADSREGQIIHELLRDFQGVLVSDFYAAYSAIPCQQQKCLIHLMRDLNDEILGNPFDEEMKSIVARFAGLLKPIVDTIDRRGLKRYFLKKHLTDVDRFYEFLEASDFKSETALKCKNRFEKNRDTLFTFLHYDGVPWNNNNAEHAIKAFAGLRDVLSGSVTKASLDDYLTLLSVAETCKYQGLDFLNFLCSEETDIDTFVRCRRNYR
jgi:predicted RecB family nuclease